MNNEKDFLDEIIEESTAKNPDFPRLLAEAEAKRAADKIQKLEEDQED